MQTELMRFTPANDLIRDRFDRWFNQVVGEFALPDAPAEVAGRRWTPAVDIRETADAVILAAELPGLTKDDIQITLENNVLTISGERKFAKETKDDAFHRVERTYGSFSRAFTLPGNVKTDKVEADFKDGVLNVTLPKADESKPRQISIR